MSVLGRKQTFRPLKKGPGSGQLPGLSNSLRLGSGVLGFGVHRLSRRQLLRSPAAVDLSRPHRLRYLAAQLDREQPVLQVRALDLDVVGKREAPLERALGEALLHEVPPAFSAIA